VTPPNPPRGRARPRLIVVEDNFAVADGLKYLLEGYGCDVVGMVGDVARALDLVASVPFDLVLLDIDLRGEHVGPVAEAAQHQGRPVIFLSGYGEADVLPPDLRALPRLDKPVDSERLLAAIARALAVTPVD
jgi:DNA-binding LytR/AlgR family response regulator